jgi:hypothetical protein
MSDAPEHYGCRRSQQYESQSSAVVFIEAASAVVEKSVLGAENIRFRGVGSQWHRGKSTLRQVTPNLFS